MDWTTASRTAVVVAAAAGALAATTGSASAESPPASWADVRTMNCDGVIVEAAFTPGGVFTSFHVLGSSDVIVPKRVQVVLPLDQPMAWVARVLRVLPGALFDRAAANARTKPRRET